MSSRFKKIFLIRFLGYLFIFSGFLATALSLEPVVAEEFKYNTNIILGRKFVLPNIVTSGQEATSPPAMQRALDRQGQTNPQQESPGFGGVLSSSDQIIRPASTDFGIVIEKINANAKVVADVDPGNEKIYTQALAQGVAHAKGSVYPGQKGNTYLFSHSTDAPWNFVRYNAIFYLLGKMDVGDRIIMFYKGRRYDYTVFDKRVVSPAETNYLTDSYNQSVLTLQTCDPPGTLINRLIIRAKMGGDGN